MIHCFGSFEFVQVHSSRLCFKTGFDTIAFLGLTLYKGFWMMVVHPFLFMNIFIHIDIVDFNSKYFPSMFRTLF